MKAKELFGKFFKEKRLELEQSLRQFCMNNKFDPGNISKMERGLLSPPGKKELEKYAIALKIEEGTDDWIKFFDYAAACRGEIPAEILNNEQVVEKLPLFFRTLRGEKVPEDKLNELIDLIKRS
ncbi:MAG: hypothetical protein GY754_00905 [bacterium]|nr:hypothetical protein [bacterium]